MTDLVLTDIDGGCATITLNRPLARNALSAELVEALERAVDAVGNRAPSDAVRVVVLAGAGKAFCAGMDIKSVMADPEGMRGAVRGLARVMRSVRDLPVPTVSRVQVAAIGGGCGLMVATDFTVTHDEARLGYPGADVGISPAAVAPWVARRIGAGRARAMLLEGQIISGREAAAMGLVTHLVERDRLERHTTELAARFAAGNLEALVTTKRWLNELEGRLPDDLVERGADRSADVLTGAEAQTRLRERFGPDGA
jgi:methylglutaconyl-CoA hydratase